MEPENTGTGVWSGPLIEGDVPIQAPPEEVTSYLDHSDHVLLAMIAMNTERQAEAFERIAADFGKMSAALERMPGAKLFGRRVIGDVK